MTVNDLVTGSSPLARGLLSPVTALPWAAGGSSPLARGLPQPRKRLPRRGRIIPARAGFTETPRTAGPRAPDHPRSRGVYLAIGVGVAVAAGSSPLARGLRSQADLQFEETRIIPARAGFTRESRFSAARFSDHPRSRGVYISASLFVPAVLGSSPLARGLRRGY